MQIPTVKLYNYSDTVLLNEVYRLFFDQNARAYEAEDCFLVSSVDMPWQEIDLLAESTFYQVQSYLELNGEKLYPQSAEVSGKLLRRELKRQAYAIFSAYTGIAFPWGSLTGIRPSLVAARELQRTAGDWQEAKDYLHKHWYVAEDKAELALEVAEAEAESLARLPENNPLLYLGIPFCNSRCAYCSFICVDAEKQEQNLAPYLDAVIKELEAVCDFLRSQRLDLSAFYMGGGTPTSPSEDLFNPLISKIAQTLPMLADAEMTVEAGRPDSISKSKLQAIKAVMPEARICINPQTMHNLTLARIGRDHSVEEALHCFTLARELGYRHINMDLILGLPGESKNMFADSLNQLLDLAPESITVHTLSLKRGAYFKLRSAEDFQSIRFPEQEMAKAMASAIALLKRHGYAPYYMYRQKNVRAGLENTGFAKAGHACLYNVGMMSDRRTVIGVGSGASSKLVSGERVERSINPKDIRDYTNRIDEIIARKIAFLTDFFVSGNQ